MAAIEIEIQQQLAAYLAGRMSLADFYRWLSSRSADSRQWGNPVAEQLAMRLMNLVSVHVGGGWTEAELKEECRPLLRVQEAEAIRRPPASPYYMPHATAATVLEERLNAA